MNRYRIVLADDHLMVRQGLGMIIKGAAGLKVIGDTGNGAELLSLLSKVSPHMVILDIPKPHHRGIESVRTIKMEYPTVKVLALTMHREYLHKTLAAGADGFLLKEDTDLDLFAAIENIRQGRIYLSPRLTKAPLIDRLPSAEPLSSRGKEVLRLVAEGNSNKEIAKILSIGVRTVESHRAHIMAKLRLNSTAELVKHAIQEGYI